MGKILQLSELDLEGLQFAVEQLMPMWRIPHDDIREKLIAHVQPLMDSLQRRLSAARRESENKCRNQFT